MGETRESETQGNEALQHYRDALGKLEKEENKYKSDKIEIDQTQEKFANAMKEQSKNISHWKRQISKLELTDIPGEDKGELRVYQSEEDMEELAAINIETMEHEMGVEEENLAAKR